MAPARPGVASPWGDPRGRGYHARRIHFAAGTHRCHPLIPGTAWFVTVAAVYDRPHSLNLRKPAGIESVDEFAVGGFKIPSLVRRGGFEAIKFQKKPSRRGGFQNPAC